MKVMQSKTAETVRQLDPVKSHAVWPAAHSILLAKADEELQAGRTQHAVELLRRGDMADAWMANAMGVCQLRQGQAEAAVKTFRTLAVNDHLSLRADAPVVFKVNFATALLLSGNLSGCISTLKDIRNEKHHSVERLQAALDHWKKSLSFWERMNWALGGEPSRPVAMESPGDLK